jgi:colicin import membrane protein
MPTITAVPRTLINAWLQGLRLPLTVVERVTDHAGANWPPALAYESFEGEAKKVLGAIIRDEELVRQGTLQQAKISELAEAERLGVKAEQARQEADAKLDARRQAAEQARARVEQQAKARQQQLQREKASKQRKVREEAARREAATARSSERRAKLVTAQERQAERTRIAEEQAALAKRSEALDTSRKAQRLDAALAAKKAQRKSA